MRFLIRMIVILALFAAAVPPRAEELRVTEDGVGTAVEKLVLKGRADGFPAGTKAYYWTRVVGGRAGDRIRHVWIHEGKEISIGLAIGGPHWRTYSSKDLGADQLGKWVVEARDQDGNVLSRREFTCTAE